MSIESNLTPPQGVREALRRGLELHEAGHSGEGLQPETVAWARRMASGEKASRDKIVKMRAWHARHAVDKRPDWDNPPTPGYVAFLLWGGEPGRVWSEKVAAMIDREEDEKAVDELEQKAKPARFVSQVAANLPISLDASWDGGAAIRRMLDAAGIGGEEPDFAQARRGFLVVDAANPELRGSYKLPIADVIDGELTVVAGGLRAAASRLSQTDAPAEVLDKARAALERYQAKLAKLRGKAEERKTAKITEADLDAEEAGVFTGYASIFGNVDSHGDAVMPGAFRKSLSERGNVVPLLWQHDQAEPVGVIELVEDSKGLRVVRGEINLETARGREAYALLKQGAIKGLSIGFQTIKDGWSGKVRQLKELKLMEVSLVTFPANELATVTAVKNDDDTHRIRMAQVLTMIEVGMENLMRARALMEALVMEEPEYSTPPEGAAPEGPDMPEEDMPDGMDELAALLRAALKG